MAFGPQAIGKLRALLFRREPSGLFQPCCRVVATLATLGADDVLIEFLTASHDIADPVENAGEEAVLNAAARALRGTYPESVFDLLLSLANEQRLPGLIEVLGRFHRTQALTCIVAALGDDLARPAAEAAIREFGQTAWPALLRALGKRDCEYGPETESSRRRRRSALALLLETGGSEAVPPEQRRS